MKREAYLDFLKSISIFFVIFYHFLLFDYNIFQNPSPGTYFGFFFRAISACGVPLFFMVNGALMLNSSFQLKKHIRKIITLLILAAVWNAILIFITMPVTQEYLTLEQLWDALKNYKLGWTNHLWFINSLICIYLLFPLMKAAYDYDSREKTHTCLFFLMIALLFSFGNTLFNIPWHIFEYWEAMKLHGTIPQEYFPQVTDINFFEQLNPLRPTSAYTSVYFLIGGYLHQNREALKKKFHTLLLAVSIPLCLLAIGFYGIMLSYMSWSVWDTVWSSYDSIFTLCMCTAVYLLAVKLSYPHFITRFLTVLGTNTLGIYFIHRFIGLFFQQYFAKLPFSDTLPMNLLFCFGVLLLSLAVTLAGKKLPLLKHLFALS